MEKTLYSEYFAIPESRIGVRLWSMNVPEVSPEPPVVEGPYVSAVGSNARDYQTLLEAARLLPDVPMVWVVRRENVAGFELPSNVSVLSDVPYPKAMNVVKHSRLTVVPLKGSEVPCGHVTLVSGMLLEKALVVTDSSGISDYVTDGWNGLLCEPRNPADMAEKIRTLWDDPQEASRLGANGFSFAEKYCAEQSARKEISAYLKMSGLTPDVHQHVEQTDAIR
ncbi:MAG TPA: glycosyltransferase [Terriglobales bacterium]